MILADTNIISTLERVQATDLLRQMVRVQRLHVAPATFQELRRAVEAGCHFLVPTVQAIENAAGWDLAELNRAETITSLNLPSSLGRGEAESIAVCVHRPGSRLVTNDKRARNYCREHRIACLDLPTILRGLWLRQVIGKEEVRALITRIEQEPGMVIKRKEEIFS